MKSYGQFCPVAKAAEILSEKWTMLILRDLFGGSRHFNELRRGVPLMSPSLLSTRLKRLVEVGVIERRVVAGNGATEYHLTAPLPRGAQTNPAHGRLRRPNLNRKNPLRRLHTRKP